MKSLVLAAMLPGAVVLGCGGGHAGKDAAGGGSIGGTGGSVSTDASVDHSCGAPAQTYTFVTERIRTLDTGFAAAGFTLRADGAPLVYYWGGPSGQRKIWVTGRPETDDAGVSVSVGLQLSRQPDNGDVTAAPVVRATRGGEVRIAYRSFIPGATADIPPRYIEWSGDFNQDPVDTPITTNPVPIFLTFDLDPQDRPGVLYRIGADIYLATNLGTGWQSEIAYSVPDPEMINALSGFKVALTFDGAGAPVLFPLPITNDLYVATKGAQGWTSGLLDPQRSAAVSELVGRDGLGQIEVIFEGVSAARRAVGTPGAWDLNVSMPSVAASGADLVRTPTAMALGSAGEIHALYEGDPFIYAYYDGCTWSTQSMTGVSGGVIGITLDGGGRPHIAYGKSGTMGEIWYAHPAP